MKKVVVGILAHVDAGKTTLSEGILYLTGKIRQQGRVDLGSAHLDTHTLERERGITIFASQAVTQVGDMEMTLLDTPGHIDFSAEMERTLSVLDYAILVISGTDGVQAHTETLWRLLSHYHIPTFLFVTKMDVTHQSHEDIMTKLQQQLDPACMDFHPDSQCVEDIALLDEKLMETYLETEELPTQQVAQLIRMRKLFPCFFGSGLKLQGVEEFLQGLCTYTLPSEYPEDFSAQIFKVSRDPQGKRLTWMKITGGALKVRMPISYVSSSGALLEEKISQIRIYSGEKFEVADEVLAGTVCAVLGLSETIPGSSLGSSEFTAAPLLEPVLAYRVLLPEGCDPRIFLPKLRLLEEEDPTLHITWKESLGEIHMQLMGEVQVEIVKSLIAQRFGVQVEMDEGKILYKETIAVPVEGVGHFEPLRHYAEVHLLMEPLPQGSGLVFHSTCPTDSLALNWQRLILTHLAEKQHIGVLTGSPITDMRITLTAGRAHVKHTEGGDFRQATYRAVRQGLMEAQSILLEPYYQFRLSVPTEYTGRALSDIQKMHGTANPPQEQGDKMVITGTAPLAAMTNYSTEVVAYTRGRGTLSCQVGGYAPCHNAEEVISQIQYQPESDVENTPDSVFCSHGAGYVVKWDQVKQHMHLKSTLRPPKEEQRNTRTSISDQELEAIMLREFGPIKRPLYSRPVVSQPQPVKKPDAMFCKYVFIDGYNVIFAWDELKELAQEDLGAAREAFIDILSNYQGYQGCDITLVFDAYLVERGVERHMDIGNLHLVYTAQGEPADVYIARQVKELEQNYSVRVITSDHLVRLSTQSGNILLMSAREFIREISSTQQQVRQIIQSKYRPTSQTIEQHLKEKS